MLTGAFGLLANLLAVEEFPTCGTGNLEPSELKLPDIEFVFAEPEEVFVVLAALALVLKDLTYAMSERS